MFIDKIHLKCVFLIKLQIFQETILSKDTAMYRKIVTFYNFGTPRY